MATTKKKLLELLKGMDEQQQRSLMDYAEFLHQKSPGTAALSQSNEKLSPLDLTRPENENVMTAIKRLRACYFMIDTDAMLNETTSLMTQYMMQGRDAGEVIDELEALFNQHYQDYLQS